MICDEDPLRRRPRESTARPKATGEVCLDGEKNDRVAFQARADYQNHASDGCIGDTVPLAVGKWMFPAPRFRRMANTLLSSSRMRRCAL